MKRYLAAPIALALAIVMIGPSASAAPRTIFVDDNCNATQNGSTQHPFCTINAGVGAAVSGDTVKVRPGFYHEIVGIGTPNIKLLGAQSGRPANAKRSDMSKESVVSFPNGDFKIQTDGITINGFTVQDVTDVPLSNEAGISITGSGFHIVNNIIRNNVEGLAVESPGTTSSNISGNLFMTNNNTCGSCNAGTGIDTINDVHNLLISKNKFIENQAQSILFEKLPVAHTNLNVTKNVFDTPFLFYNVNGATISRNASLGNAGSALFFGDGDQNVTVARNVLKSPAFRGIRFRVDFGGPAPTLFTIRLNVIDGAGIDGMALGDPADGTPAALTNSTITTNTIRGSSANGIQAAAGSIGNTFMKNTIRGSDVFDVNDFTTGTGTAGTGNNYSANHCSTSSPAGLC